MTRVGCDLHTRKQQVAVLDTQTGETHERQLVHEGSAVEEFYTDLPRPVTVGIESTGYAIWFHALMHRLGHTVLVGDAAKIRAMVVRKTKTDQRDARHLLDLLRHDRFPTVWVPDPATRDLRALLTHRRRLVRLQTMLKNGLHAIALNQRLARGSKLLRHATSVEDGWRECSGRGRAGRPPPLLPLGPQVQQLDLLRRHAGHFCKASDDIACGDEMRVGACRKSNGEATYFAGRS